VTLPPHGSPNADRPRATASPVALEVAPPARIGRRGVLARLVAGPALGIAGPLSLWPAAVVHVALPATSALHLAGEAADDYLDDHGPRVIQGLEWLLGLHAWASLVADRPPWGAGARPVRLQVARSGAPRPGRAMGRVVTGLPAAAGLLLMEAIALVPWLAAAVCVLVAGRQPRVLWRLQAGLLGWRARHLVRQASLVPAPGPAIVRRACGFRSTSARESSPGSRSWPFRWWASSSPSRPPIVRVRRRCARPAAPR